ncbi:hypothetical protein K0M31_017665, partial [Melipona bicolor]
IFRIFSYQELPVRRRYRLEVKQAASSEIRLLVRPTRLPNVIPGERLGTKEQRLDSINFTLSSTLETLVSAEDLIRGSSLC